MTTTAVRMTEDQLLHVVLDLCGYKGLRVHHCRPARTEQGWRTPIQGHAGFVDLVILGPGGVLWRELKSERGRPTPDQEAWLKALIDAGENAGIWRPSHLDVGVIGRELTQLSKGAAHV